MSEIDQAVLEELERKLGPELGSPWPYKTRGVKVRARLVTNSAAFNGGDAYLVESPTRVFTLDKASFQVTFMADPDPSSSMIGLKAVVFCVMAAGIQWWFGHAEWAWPLLLCAAWIALFDGLVFTVTLAKLAYCEFRNQWKKKTP